MAEETVSKPTDKISIKYISDCSEQHPSFKPVGSSVCKQLSVNNKDINRSGKTNDIISPVGRLRDRIHVWDQLQVDRYIRDVVINGYKLPFKDLPSNCILRNNKSARDNPDFVNSEIEKLLTLGCISEVSEQPCVVNPLTVAYGKSGKARMVLDCRHINPHLIRFRHKYEDLSVAKELFRNHEFLFTYDLKSAYHIIEIFSQHRQYLGFSWDGHFYVFNVLAFGLATAGFIFSKVMRCPIRYFRSQGHKVVMFLDDGLGGHVEKEAALSLSRHVHS